MSDENANDNADRATNIRSRPKLSWKRSRKYGTRVLVVDAEPLPENRQIILRKGADGRWGLVEIDKED
jgi:hypothetical protein